MSAFPRSYFAAAYFGLFFGATAPEAPAAVAPVSAVAGGGGATARPHPTKRKQKDYRPFTMADRAELDAIFAGAQPVVIPPVIPPRSVRLPEKSWTAYQPAPLRLPSGPSRKATALFDTLDSIDALIEESKPKMDEWQKIEARRLADDEEMMQLLLLLHGD